MSTNIVFIYFFHNIQLNDLLYFVVILVVFMLAYGVAKQAVLYPNTRDVKEAFVNIWNRPYWQMYGELFYEDIFGEYYDVKILGYKLWNKNIFL